MSILSRIGPFSLAIAIAAAFPLSARAESDFTLTLDGENFEVRTDIETQIRTKDGRSLKVMLTPSAIQNYRAKGIRFQHPMGLSVAAREIDPGVTQHMVSSALGTLLIVQVYDDIDPTTLIDLMTSEMTKDDVAAGATLKTQKHQYKASDGSNLVGTRSSLKANRDDLVLDVLATARGRGGVLLISRHDSFTAPEDKVLVDNFWKTVAFD